MAVTKIRDEQASQSVSLTTEVTGVLPTANGGTNQNNLTNLPLTTPAITGLPTGSGVSASASASTLVARDSNANHFANSLFQAFTSTATAGGTTTLTVASAPVQVFTGSSTQTVVLPTTGVPAGARYIVVNQSSGAVTVQSSGANTITILAPATSATFFAVVATPTTAANWAYDYFGDNVASGKVFTVSNTLTLVGTDGTTLTMPGATDTLAGLAATQTFTNKRITKRVVTVSQSATPTINCDTTDVAVISGLAQAVTSITVSGTPTAEQQLTIKWKDNGTARAIAHGSSFMSSGVAPMLTTTIANKWHRELYVYDADVPDWVCVAVDATGY